MVLALSFYGLALATENFNIALNAGEAFVINGAGAAEVHYSGNPNCFSVQPRADNDLLVLGACRGSGTIKTMHNGTPAIYHVTVNAIADPNKPLKAGKAPPAMTDDSNSSTAVKVTAVSSSGAVKAPPLPAANSEPAAKPSQYNGAVHAENIEYSGIHTETVQDRGVHTETLGSPATKAASSPVAVVPSQAEPPTFSLGKSPGPLEQAAALHKYRTDPPAPRSYRDMDMSGTHPLPNDTISLMTGNSQVFDFTSPIERVSIANSKIADIQVVSPRQLLLVGHKPGFTTLVVWNTFGQYEQRQVRIEQTGHQQVMLNVVVAEVNRTKIEQQGVDLSVALKKIGISLASLPGNVASPYTTQLGFIGSPASNLLSFAPPGGTAFPLLLSNNITYALAAQNPNVSTNSFFQFLESHDLVRILAQPRILANFGEKAQFLSGGEIPIVIAQALNTSIVFKQFGTSVIFVPTVVGRHEIELRVKPEVSKPDYSQGVQLFGFTVPAFVTQRAETDVRMRENQTVIIAGLILDNNQATVKKVPYLGDAPYVGALFRNTYYDHVRTELVMSVTPRIVGALPPGGQVALPTERGSFTTEEIRTEELDAADPSRPRF
jgi:pilus assembly protein CpaC